MRRTSGAGAPLTEKLGVEFSEAELDEWFRWWHAKMAGKPVRRVRRT
jgi:hypothetical protein